MSRAPGRGDAAAPELDRAEIPGVAVFLAPEYRDARGHFTTPLRASAFRERVGRELFPIAEISHSVSARDVLRGIHYTAVPPGRAKYIYCPHGSTEHFLVDLRLDSPAFGRAQRIWLHGASGRAIYVPIGVGHGLLSHRDGSVVTFLMSAGYRPDRELAIDAADPALGLPLPPDPARSDRDRTAPTLAAAERAGLLPTTARCLAAEDALWRDLSP